MLKISSAARIEEQFSKSAPHMIREANWGVRGGARMCAQHECARPNWATAKMVRSLKTVVGVSSNGQGTREGSGDG